MFRLGILLVLVLQNTALVIMLRISRLNMKTPYAASTAVLVGEILKTLVCLAMIVKTQKGPLMNTLYIHSLGNIPDLLKLAVPALLYLVQNNLQFVAISNLEPGPYQVLYQFKIFTTAILSVVILGKSLNSRHWFGLCALFMGVVLVQISNSTTKKKDSEVGNAYIGFLSVMVAVCCSGMSSVWFEKVLKSSSVSLWIRSWQLSSISVLLGLISVAWNDFTAIQEEGFFYGYTPTVWCVILLQSAGGIIVALVVKYADNIVKGFACSLATILSTIASYFLFHFIPSPLFLMGATAVLCSVFIYNSGFDVQKKITKAISNSAV